VIQNEVFRSNKLSVQTGFYLAHEMHIGGVVRW
jgi:hypothetical protein